MDAQGIVSQPTGPRNAGETMRSMAVACVLALGGGAAQAADWVYVGRDGDLEHFVDRESVVRQGDVARMVKRAVYTQPHPMGDTPGMPLMTETRGVVEADCTGKQHRVVSLDVIGPKGEVLWSSGDMKRVWESMDPGTPGRASLDFACDGTASR